MSEQTKLATSHPDINTGNPGTFPPYATLQSIFERAGVEIDSHASDLYVPVSEETTEILRSYREQTGLPCSWRKFKCNISGDWWYDIPFHYAEQGAKAENLLDEIVHTINIAATKPRDAWTIDMLAGLINQIRDIAESQNP